MNQLPPSDELPDDLDDLYRRASAHYLSCPSESVRTAVLAQAARLAAERTTARSPRSQRRYFAVVGALAAAVFAGLLVTPVFLSHPGFPVHTTPPVAAPAAPTAQEAPSAQARLTPSAPSPPPPAAPTPKNQSVMMTAQRAKKPSDAPVASAAPDAFISATPAAALATAARDRGADLRRAAESGDTDTLNWLFSEHADLEAKDAEGRTALMLAVLQGHTASVTALLAQGANPRAEDAYGATPLSAALAGNNPAIAALLSRYVRAAPKQ
jgi:hypothetical protein